MATEKDAGNGWLILSVMVNVVLACITWGQYQEAQRATAQSFYYAEETLKLQREIADKETERALEEKKQSIAPMLVVKRCCNQVPISIAERAYSKESPRISLRRLDVSDPDLIRVDEDVRLRNDNAFVVRIANVGLGAAIGTKVFWEIEKVVLSDDRVISVAERHINGHMKPYVWPATLRPGDEAELMHLPYFMEQDSNLRVVSVTGFLRISCDDTAQEPHVFRQPFTMDTVYEPELPDDLYGTRLSFHFYEPGTTPETHIMARPAF